MIDNPVLVFAIIGALGVGSQWLAWRLQLPAIVLMLAAGLAAGPGFGVIDPEAQLGDLFRPIVAIALAVILFEGGITLNFRELGGDRLVVRRLVYLGAPLCWAFSAAAAHFIAGLDWASAAVFGGILVITGPTVVIPLLRQARLSQRPAAMLRWEAIINDPVGALFAVFAFEVAYALSGAVTLAEAAGHLAVGVAVASVVGYVAGRLVVHAFREGLAPEYMKAPILLAAVLAVYASTDAVLHESGLLAVTVMGVVIGNARLPSLTELIRFKEHMTILLVSGVFILLAASLDIALIAELDWRAAAFVAAVMFVARPLAVGLSLIGTDLKYRERAIVAWVGPRGVVAVAVAGFFGGELAHLGFEGGASLGPLAFALVAATVVLHGFTISPIARALGLKSTKPPGVLIIGGSRFATALARAVGETGAPALIADANWWSLRQARQEGLETWRGEILSEAFEHHIDVNRFGVLLAATQNDAYNAFVCTDFGPEFGRENVRQIARHEGREGADDLPVTLGGRGVAGGEDFDALDRRMQDGWRVVRTGLTDEYGFEDYRAARPGAVMIGALRASGKLVFFAPEDEATGASGDEIIALTPPDEDRPAKRETPA